MSMFYPKSVYVIAKFKFLLNNCAINYLNFIVKEKENMMSNDTLRLPAEELYKRNLKR